MSLSEFCKTLNKDYPIVRFFKKKVLIAKTMNFTDCNFTMTEEI